MPRTSDSPVISNWHTLFEGSSTSTQEFYAAVEGGHEEPEPESAEEDEPPVELRVVLPKGLPVTPAVSEAWLKTLASLRSSASFELVGSGGQVSVVLTARRRDVPLLTSQVRAFFPGVSLEEREDLLLSAWEAGEEGVFSAVEFGLAREFMLPLERSGGFSPDPLTSIVGALAEAGPGEVAIVQVLFQGVRAPWAESVARSVVTPSGDPFFADAPELTKLAREKVSAPLFAVAVRTVARAASEERCWTLLSGTLGALSGATRGDNELVPLGSGDIADILADVVLRTTHRPGVILSLPETHDPGAPAVSFYPWHRSGHRPHQGAPRRSRRRRDLPRVQRPRWRRAKRGLGRRRGYGTRTWWAPRAPVSLRSWCP